ncbi:MAG: UPF0280 family protein [Elusimicrobiales bacterium]
MKSPLFVPRAYRDAPAAGRRSFTVCCRDTDLWIAADPVLEPLARREVLARRAELEAYIARRRDFLTALAPLPDDETAPPIVREMMAAARLAGVGPMAAVAGAVAEAVGRRLLESADGVIVENGGDIFLKSGQPAVCEVFAGNSPFSGRLAYEADASAGCGLCTSSGTVGHSLSFGKADAATILCAGAAEADAYATAVGNMIKNRDDIAAALAYVKTQPRIKGCAVIIGDAIGIYGDLRVVKL